MENAFDFYIISIAQDITASYVSNGFYYFGNNKQEYHIVTPEKIVFFISKKAFFKFNKRIELDTYSNSGIRLCSSEWKQLCLQQKIWIFTCLRMLAVPDWKGCANTGKWLKLIR